MHFPLGIKANSWPSAALFGSLVPTYDLCTSINPPVQQKTEYRARKQDAQSPCYLRSEEID